MKEVFVSYASENRRLDANRKLFDEFLSALTIEVAGNMGTKAEDLAFMAERSIETGEDWPEVLREALRSSRVMICLYSAHYFNSPWCGRELQVFLERSKGRPPTAPPVVLPVLWIPSDVPAVITHLQYAEDAYPENYRKRGVRKLLDLKAEHDFKETISVLAERIQRAIEGPALPNSRVLGSFDSIPNVWQQAAAQGGPRGAGTRDGNRALFVFVAGNKQELGKVRTTCDGWGASDGWEWQPFHPYGQSVGAIAQTVAGQKNLRFEQLPCDAALPAELKKAKKNRVPVVIFTDPWSAQVAPYADVLQEYDDLNLMNCSLLVPWNLDDPETQQQRTELKRNLRMVCPQKLKAISPGHYWEIADRNEFLSRASTVLDEATLRILDLAADGELRKAESVTLEAEATKQGISTEAPSQLLNVQPQGSPNA